MYMYIFILHINIYSDKKCWKLILKLGSHPTDPRGLIKAWCLARKKIDAFYKIFKNFKP